MSNTIGKHRMKNIEVATRDKIHLRFQSPIFKQILAIICTVTNIFNPRIMHEHVYYNQFIEKSTSN
jgi:hypothetical protein